MRFCGNCGNMIEDNAAFCPNCGTKVVSENGNPVSKGSQDVLKDISQGVSSFVVNLKNKVADKAANINNNSSAYTDSFGGYSTGETVVKKNSVLHLGMIWVFPFAYALITVILAFKCITGGNFISAFGYSLSSVVYEESILFWFIDCFFGLMFLGVGTLFIKARMSYAAYKKRGSRQFRNAILLFGVIIVLYLIYFSILSSAAYGIDIMADDTASLLVLMIFINIIMLIVNTIHAKKNKDIYTN